MDDYDLFIEEHPMDFERIDLIREGADKVLAYMLDYCATSFDDQEEILKLALAETRLRIARRNCT